MKKIFKYITAAALSSVLLTNTSCIEEVFPTDAIIESQLDSKKGLEARLWGIVSCVNNFNTMGLPHEEVLHIDFGYGSMMHIRDLMTADLAIPNAYSGHWAAYHTNTYMGKSYMMPQYIWNYYWKLIHTTNLMVRDVVKNQKLTETEKGYLGAAYAFRALAYLDVAQMYEFLPNEIYKVNEDGKNITNLTVPIVTDKTTKEEAANNPRATREQMAEFILGDLDLAEENIPYLTVPDKVIPHLDVVYGLKARLYLWIENYAKAKEYARKAIDEARQSPMNEDQWLDPTTGFNTLDYWMLGVGIVKENEVVQSGIVNWAGWMCSETRFGYAGVGGVSMIDASLYDAISNTDFRKLAFKAPEGSPLLAQSRYIDANVYAGLAPYTNLKFRPGGGNISDYQVACTGAYPMMRVEEMYFIEAEAAAHLNAKDGEKLLTDFMKNYRDKKYVYTGKRDIIEEIILQKRIETWGEGLSFYDIKRLDMSVIRGYANTNFMPTARLNTKGRPVWMNISIVQTEENNNQGVLGFNNPDPSDKIQIWR